MIRKHWFSILILVSLIFLSYKLISMESVAIPDKCNRTGLIASFLFLGATFVLLALRWKKTLAALGMNASFKESIISTGLPVFSKYIPGKVFMIVGKTGFLNKRKGYSLKQLTMAALIDQLLALFTGIVFGSIFLIRMESLALGLIPGVLLLSLILLLLLHRSLLNILVARAGKLIGKDLVFDKPGLKLILKLLPWHVCYWICAGCGFFLLSYSLNDLLYSPEIGMAFPLAVSAGIAAIFAPGGLGIRESVLLGSFRVLGFSSEVALPVVVISRLWFIAGEFLFFILALGLKATIQNSSASRKSG